VNIADATRSIKKELSGDEKLLENAFKLETLYKKYKFLLWAIVLALVLFFIGKTVMESMQNSRLEEANQAFLILQDKADDKQALTILKEKNPALFELFSYSQAAKTQDKKVLNALSGSTNVVVADVSKYTAAVIDNKPIDSKIYKEMALLEEAYLSIKAGDINNARAKLELIDDRSPLSVTIKLLKHYLIKEK